MIIKIAISIVIVSYWARENWPGFIVKVFDNFIIIAATQYYPFNILENAIIPYYSQLHNNLNKNYHLNCQLHTFVLNNYFPIKTFILLLKDLPSFIINCLSSYNVENNNDNSY